MLDLFFDSLYILTSAPPFFFQACHVRCLQINCLSQDHWYYSTVCIASKKKKGILKDSAVLRRWMDGACGRSLSNSHGAGHDCEKNIPTTKDGVSSVCALEQ